MMVNNGCMEEYVKDGRLSIVVKTGCSKNKVIKFDEEKNALRVEIGAKAESGKANLEVVKFISKLLKKKVVIVKGKTSKRKVLLVK